MNVAHCVQLSQLQADFVVFALATSILTANKADLNWNRLEEGTTRNGKCTDERWKKGNLFILLINHLVYKAVKCPPQYLRAKKDGFLPTSAPKPLRFQFIITEDSEDQNKSWS